MAAEASRQAAAVVGADRRYLHSPRATVPEASAVIPDTPAGTPHIVAGRARSGCGHAEPTGPYSEPLIATATPFPLSVRRPSSVWASMGQDRVWLSVMAF